MTEETKKEEEAAAVAETPVPAADAGDADKDKAEKETGDATTPPPAVETKLTEDEMKVVESIKERLQFFFSNANLRQDLFLRKLLTQSDDKAVPVDVMLRFNTIKKLSDQPNVLLTAAKQLTDLLIVDEEKSLLRRVVPFTDEMMKENLHLTLHIKNLPLMEEETEENDDDNNNKKGMKKYNVNVDEVRTLFEKYGDVALVKLQFATDDYGAGGGKRHHNRDNAKRRKYPTGTALVEYHKKEDLEKAADATLTIKKGEKVEAKEKVTLPASDSRKDPIDLDVMLFSEYLESKRNNRKGGGHHKNKRGRDEDNDDIKDNDEPPPKYTIDWKPGCVIKLKGVPENCDREAMLECLATGLGIDVDGVKSRKIYADFSRGQPDGAIRFPEPTDDIANLTKRLKEGELKINDAKVEEVYILEGDEEKKYWDDFMAFKTKQLAEKHERKRRKSHHRSR